MGKKKKKKELVSEKVSEEQSSEKEILEKKKTAFVKKITDKLKPKIEKKGKSKNDSARVLKLKSFCNKFYLKKIAILFVVLLFLLLVIVPVGVYFYGPLGEITRPIFKKIPYPVAFVGEDRSMISTKQLIQNVDAVRKFYEDQDLTGKGLRVDFTTPDGEMRLKIKEKEILDKQVEDQIIKQLGNENGIVITVEDAQKELDSTVKKAGSKKAVELKLAALYGWGFNDLRDKVIIYQMYTNKLLEKYSEISKKQEAYQEMEKARKELEEDGSNFAEISKKYSEGESVKNEGELGWFPLNKIDSEVAVEIMNYKKGQISGVISSRLGFHIVQLQDYRETEIVLEDDDDVNNLKKGDIIKNKEVKIRQIFKPGISFVKWVEQKKQKTKVSVWMKDYEWDQSSGHIRFADEQMRLLEKRIKNRSQADPSIK